MPKIKTIFMGTPEFSIPTLEALIKSDFIEVTAVVCNPDKPVGRDQILTLPPTKILAQENNIPVIQPDRIRKPEWIEKIKDLKPDLIIVAAFGQIIPKDILDIPKYKSINVHGSLLPKLKGASPIQYAVLEGYKKTGVTIMIMDELMDHGPILSQRDIELSPKETAHTLHDKMSVVGAELLMDTLPDWIDGKITPKEQDHENATLTKIISKEDGKIVWADDADKIERKIRAFNPWPSTFCLFKDQDGKEKRLKILESDVEKCDKENEGFGRLFTDDKNNLIVKTGKDCLKLIKMQPEGKNPMSSAEFLNGYAYLLKSQLE